MGADSDSVVFFSTGWSLAIDMLLLLHRSELVGDWTRFFEEAWVGVRTALDCDQVTGIQIAVWNVLKELRPFQVI